MKKKRVKASLKTFSKKESENNVDQFQNRVSSDDLYQSHHSPFLFK